MVSLLSLLPSAIYITAANLTASLCTLCRTP